MNKIVLAVLAASSFLSTSVLASGQFVAFVATKYNVESSSLKSGDIIGGGEHILIGGDSDGGEVGDPNIEWFVPVDEADLLIYFSKHRDDESKIKYVDLKNLTSVPNSMFGGNINVDVSNWKVSTITDFSRFFMSATGSITGLDKWDMSNAVNFSNMFAQSNLSGLNIGAWDVSNVRDFSNMFLAATTNEELNEWDVSNGDDFSRMFQDATFNKPLNKWNVSNGSDFSAMFSFALTFNQDISNWNISSSANTSSADGGSPIEGTSKSPF